MCAFYVFLSYCCCFVDVSALSPSLSLFLLCLCVCVGVSLFFLGSLVLSILNCGQDSLRVMGFGALSGLVCTSRQNAWVFLHDGDTDNIINVCVCVCVCDCVCVCERAVINE